MIIDKHLERTIGGKLLAEQAKRALEHEKSGKLSAGKLFWPVQWQVLYSLGIDTPGFDAYTLRKFARGNHVEDFVVSNMDGLIEAQKEVEYKGVIGFVDAVVDSSAGWEFRDGIIPHEVKSVTNAKFKWIEKRLTPDESHCMQATLYALAMGVKNSVIDYVASDDYRITSFVVPVSDWSQQVESAIDEYEAAMNLWKTKHILPELEPKVAWQIDPKYATYPDTVGKTAKEVVEMIGL